ncbi:uroporphyrinogen-III synthase [Cryptosporangium phraense]|uniref:Bifunctional uroporphyrinogen-III C-methyltransferase/uroporphyrinogen-III synthase n=1 Tax=Cryptosporangium phraense TaxID=2593070 RepID=A0A545AGQ4_9ACTN|nr:uroporphyrinogen-III synthase [Cryptosporangium phraense]TQS39845.1 bifunctional uroporphyrinogen-III C-methyltransferase/uroporphyrinogen-III synthase [Cryptosporangium phraense]
MTRRSTTGRITFVGAGPGDPGLLTRRALEAVADADHILHDRSLPPTLLAAVVASAPESVEVSVAEGAAGDVAKVLLSGARSGRTVARLVAGDPLTSESIVREVQAVARTSVPFEVVPGVPLAEGVTGYAGAPAGGLRTTVEVRDVTALDFDAMVAVPGTLTLTLDAGDLPAVRDGLLSAGMSGQATVLVTGDGTTDTQSTSVATLDGIVDAAIGLYGTLVVSIGAGVGLRDKLSWWESRPLYGWKVLVPRTKEQAGAMSAQLRGWGAIPEEVPTIAVEPPRTPAQMERAIKGLVTGRYEWVIFTSTNAVKAVWEKFAEFGLDARAFAGVKIACVGDATAAAVEAFGVKAELLPSGEQSSDGLLADFPPYDEVLDPIDRILLPRADIATETLAAGLIERGWEVDDVTAYRTVRAAPPPAPIRDAIKSGGFDAVLFTSSSTVRNLVGIAGKPHARTVVACIGPKTADTARELGLRVDVQPETANVPSLVESLAEYALELREKLASLPAKPRRGAKAQGPTAGRLAR